MKNRTIRTLIFTGAAMLTLAFAAAVWAESKAPDNGGWVQAQGIVMGMVKTAPDANGKSSLRFGIQEDNGQILTVQACDRISSNEQGPGFALGDRVQVIGMNTLMDGLPTVESCDVRLLPSPEVATTPAAPQVTYVPSYPSTDVLIVGDVNPYDYYNPYYTPFYGLYSPFVFYPNPFFHSRFFYDRDGFRGHDREDRVGFHGSSGVRFEHSESGTWHRSSGTWTRPSTAMVTPHATTMRTSSPRTFTSHTSTPRTTSAPRTFSSTVPHHTWHPSSGVRITTPRTFTPSVHSAPRITSAPHGHGSSFSGSSMHGGAYAGGHHR